MYYELGLQLVNLPRVAEDRFTKGQIQEYLRRRGEGQSLEVIRALAAQDGFDGYFLLERASVGWQETAAKNLARRGITAKVIFEVAEALYIANSQKALLTEDQSVRNLAGRVERSVKQASSSAPEGQVGTGAGSSGPASASQAVVNVVNESNRDVLVQITGSQFDVGGRRSFWIRPRASREVEVTVGPQKVKVQAATMTPGEKRGTWRTTRRGPEFEKSVVIRPNTLIVVRQQDIEVRSSAVAEPAEQPPIGQGRKPENAGEVTSSAALDEVRLLPKGFLVALGDDPATGTKFWVYRSKGKGECSMLAFNVYVYGVVPRGVSLLDDSLAQRLVRTAAQHWVARCRLENANLRIALSHEDYQVKWGPVLWEFPPREFPLLEPEQVVASVRAGSSGYHYYTNLAKREKEELEEGERYWAMLRNKGVNAHVALADLVVNPFAHSGKTVAYCLEFFRMVTERQGLFGEAVTERQGLFGEVLKAPGGGFFPSEKEAVVVSDIPKGMFTQSQTRVGVIGRILGRPDLKGLANEELVELKFVERYRHPKWCPGE